MIRAELFTRLNRWLMVPVYGNVFATIPRRPKYIVARDKWKKSTRKKAKLAEVDECRWKKSLTKRMMMNFHCPESGTRWFGIVSPVRHAKLQAETSAWGWRSWPVDRSFFYGSRTNRVIPASSRPMHRLLVLYREVCYTRVDNGTFAESRWE